MTVASAALSEVDAAVEDGQAAQLADLIRGGLGQPEASEVLFDLIPRRQPVATPSKGDDMFGKEFWLATLERVARTVAQTLLALWLVGDVALNALTVDWGEALGVSLGAGLVSLLTSVAAFTVNPATGPSFGTETPTPPPAHRLDGPPYEEENP